MLSVRHINYQSVFLQTDWRTGWPIYRCKKRHSNGSHMETSPLYESEDCRIQIYARMHLYIGLLNNAGRTTERPFSWGAYHWGAILVGGLPLRGPFSWGTYHWGAILVRGVPLRGHSREGRTTEGSLSWGKYHWGAILMRGVLLRGHSREGRTTVGPFSCHAVACCTTRASVFAVWSEGPTQCSRRVRQWVTIEDLASRDLYLNKI